MKSKDRIDALGNIVSEVQLKYIVKCKPTVEVTKSIAIFELLKGVYDQDQISFKETFYAIYLNRRNKVLGTFKVSEGGKHGTVVDVGMVFQVPVIMNDMLKLNASGIILSHNHPSGNPKPSDIDIQLTRKIKESCKLLDFQLLDHIIITSDSYYSFADEGIL
jgi:DNA repair protein RadC